MSGNKTRAVILHERLNKLRDDLVLELSLADQRPMGWLPAPVFVENDEYEEGFIQYEVTEIHSDGTFTGIRSDNKEKETLPLSDINIDWLDLLLDLYSCSCIEQQLPDAEIRRCDHCGRPMKEGYYLAGEYACSNECCLALYNGDREAMEKDLSKADEDGWECYYTDWEGFICE